jgi:hypothetical protein
MIYLHVPRSHGRIKSVSLCYSFGVRPKNTIGYFTFTGGLIMSLFNSTFVLPKFLLSANDHLQKLSSGVHNAGTFQTHCGTPCTVNPARCGWWVGGRGMCGMGPHGKMLELGFVSYVQTYEQGAPRATMWRSFVESYINDQRWEAFSVWVIARYSCDSIARSRWHLWGGRTRHLSYRNQDD